MVGHIFSSTDKKLVALKHSVLCWRANGQSLSHKPHSHSSLFLRGHTSLWFPVIQPEILAFKLLCLHRKYSAVTQNSGLQKPSPLNLLALFGNWYFIGKMVRM